MPVDTFSDEIAQVRSMRILHHRKVMATHHTILHVLSATKLTPAIIGEVRAVVEQPSHRRWILLTLDWSWARVTWVASDTFSAPDSVGCDWLDGWFRVVVRKVTDGGTEVGQKPLRRLGWITSTEETDLVEESVETDW